jgi:hypothetical protein
MDIAKLLGAASDLSRVVANIPWEKGLKREDAPARMEDILQEAYRNTATGAGSTSVTGAAPALESKGCAECVKDHFSTVAGALTEAMRFARKEGIWHPEVQGRLSIAEDEFNIMERIDASPEALARAEPWKADLVRRFLPIARDLRTRINAVDSVEKLEEVAALAQRAKVDYRAAWLKARGAPERLVELAARVAKGEVTREEAMKEVGESAVP